MARSPYTPTERITALWGQNHPATLFGPHGRDGLGLIPAWQFSPDPRVNSNLNPNVVTFPPDASPMPGSIGFPMRAGAQLVPAQGPGSGVQLGLPIVDSWWWQNRKTLLIGTGVVVIAAVAATLSAVLR